MTAAPPVLHMICGKIAAGKSTLAAQLANADGTVLISQDDWLSALFTDQLQTGADYVRCAAKLDHVLGPHIVSLLKAGLSVVLDFPANTVAQRAHMRGLFEAANVAHQLHVLDVSDDVCLARLRQRNASGEHAFAPTEAQFHQFMKHFVLPSETEGFNLIIHSV